MGRGSQRVGHNPATNTFTFKCISLLGVNLQRCPRHSFMRKIPHTASLRIIKPIKGRECQDIHGLKDSMWSSCQFPPN